MKRWLTWLWLILLAGAVGTAGAAELCEVCGDQVVGTIYSRDDEITGRKKHFCRRCGDLPTVCYLCSIPVMRDFQTLPDGRILCARDGRSVVLDDGAALKICEQVKVDLDRQFSRFITFPDTNVTLELMDRISLQELYKVVGKDYSCPNTFGYTRPETNAHGYDFEISLLSGLPRQELQTTCVHEHTHTWLIENLPEPRAKQIGKDAIEGFCELVSFLFAEAQGLHSARSNILGNLYTRGQIHLFIEAERQFGFNEIVDWMKFGEDALLITNELARVREVILPASTNAPANPVFFAPAAAAPSFARLVLQGISWSKTRPMAMVNGRNFEPKEEAKVRIGDTNVLIRCLEIRPGAVVVQIGGVGEPFTLKLAER
jgi:hypothetical protein